MSGAGNLSWSEGRERTQDSAFEAEEGVGVAGVHRQEEQVDGKGVRNRITAVEGDDEGAFAAAVVAR